MATGDQIDFKHRIAHLIPPSWFHGGQVPVRDLLTMAAGKNLGDIYALEQYVLLQTRIASSSGVWLDRIAYDFCGPRLPRRNNEPDGAYRIRIIAEIFRPRQTRAGIIKALTDLTGKVPELYELWNPGDCGAYASVIDQPAPTTWNPADNGGAILSNGNLTATGQANTYTTVRSTTSHATGKCYAELVFGAGGGVVVTGLTDITTVLSNYLGASGVGAGVQPNQPVILHSVMTLPSGGSDGFGTPSFVNGDVLQIAVDFGAGKIWFGKNGTWANSGNPATGANPTASFTAPLSLYLAVSVYFSGDVVTLRTLASQITYTVPTGFVTWDQVTPLAVTTPITSFAYDCAGMYGDLTLRNQIFITALRADAATVNGVSGYGSVGGGYDVGALEYIQDVWVTALITDADMYATVAATVAAGMTGWTAIADVFNPPPVITAPVAPPTTWNVADAGPFIALSNNNLTATCAPGAPSGWNTVRSTTFRGAGKLYAEMQVVRTNGSISGPLGGFANMSLPVTDYISHSSGAGTAITTSNPTVFDVAMTTVNGPTGFGTPSFVVGDIMNFAIDFSLGYIWFGKNGTWDASGNPATGANPNVSFTLGRMLYLAMSGGFLSHALALRTTAAQFTNTVPAGFSPWY
jgi:hypothetical protein